MTPGDLSTNPAGRWVAALHDCGADGRKIVIRAVNEGGAALEGMAANGHTGGDDAGEELFFEILKADGLDEFERFGFDEIDADGFEEVGVVRADSSADGDGGTALAVFVDHGLQVKVVVSGGLDGDKSVIAEPVFQVTQTACRAAGEWIFGIMQVQPGGSTR